MAFASFTVKTDFPHLGEDAFTLGMCFVFVVWWVETPFNEKTSIEETLSAFKKAIGTEDVRIIYSDDTTVADPKKKKDEAKPGKPSFLFVY